jgi:dephospho-CoA kinase
LSVLRIGLTGSIGSGKSTVARLLRERGISVLDADLVAREVSGFPDVLEEIARVFGPEYVQDGGINRPKMGQLVFNDPRARTALNNIIHPRVREEMARQQAELEASGARAVAQDIPLLFENQLETLFDATILVDAPLDVRIARVVARDGLNTDAVRARDAAQMPATEKRKRTTITLENDGDLETLEAQLDVALERIGVVVGQKSGVRSQE